MSSPGSDRVGIVMAGEASTKKGSLYAGWVDEVGPNAGWPPVVSIALA